MSATQRNIVVVGGSTAGLGAAHAFFKHTYPALKDDKSFKYVVHMIEPSSHFWWRICAPRAMVSTPDFPHDKAFIPIADGFAKYDKGSYEIHQAKATAIDTNASTITFEGEISKQSQTLPYFALILATGVTTPTTLTSLDGPHGKTIAALDKMNKRLATATTILVAGGGPVGVETAGELGEKMNGAAGMLKSRPANPKAKVTLVTSGPQLLPILSKAIASKAEKFLHRVGVDVVYNTRVEKVELSAADRELQIDGFEANHDAAPGDKTIVHLSNGEKMTVDVYIPAVGVKPNSSFLPKSILDNKGKVKNDKHLRVESAGPRVYCVGDVGAYTEDGMLSIFAAIPTLTASLASDIAKSSDRKVSVKEKDKDYKFVLGQTQFVPVGRSKAVGAMKGTSLPSVLVWYQKGRNYLLPMGEAILNGSHW